MAQRSFLNMGIQSSGTWEIKLSSAVTLLFLVSNFSIYSLEIDHRFICNCKRSCINSYMKVHYEILIIVIIILNVDLNKGININ